MEDRERLRRLNMRDIHSPQREREIQREPFITAAVTLKIQNILVYSQILDNVAASLLFIKMDYLAKSISEHF